MYLNCVVFVQNDPDWKITSIMEDVKTHYHHSVSYKKAWMARTKAIEMVFCNWKQSFAKLPRYLLALQSRNSGTIQMLESINHDVDRKSVV